MIMHKVSHCPVCNSLWHTIPIPSEYHEDYSPPYYYSTVIALQTWEADRTHAYQCPNCNTQFDLGGIIIRLKGLSDD